MSDKISTSDSPSSDLPDDVRRVVGTPARDEDTSSIPGRMWALRERMIALGIDVGNDDERIRKVVGKALDT